MRHALLPSRGQCVAGSDPNTTTCQPFCETVNMKPCICSGVSRTVLPIAAFCKGDVPLPHTARGSVNCPHCFSWRSLDLGLAMQWFMCVVVHVVVVVVVVCCMCTCVVGPSLAECSA